MRRRDFLKKAAGVGAGIAAGGVLGRLPTALGEEPARVGDRLEQRPFGRSDVKLSVVALGGITLKNLSDEHCSRIMREALDAGVNWVDSSPEYGNSEPRVGKALQPYREKVFLACKTGKRRRAEAEEEFKGSLARLKTDHLDLYQLHSLQDVAKDVDVAFGKGGVMELMTEVKKAGKVRFLGFSAHSVRSAMAAMDRYDFDSVMFPVNFSCWYKGDFGPRVVEEAKKRGMAILALKGLCKQKWRRWNDPRHRETGLWYEPLMDPAEMELGMRFTLSRPVTAMIPPGKSEFFRKAIALAREYRPPTDEQLARARALAEDTRPLFVHRPAPGEDQAFRAVTERDQSFTG